MLHLPWTSIHNVRFQFIKWKTILLLVKWWSARDLPKNFATHLYGEDKAGPWVTKTDMQTLNEYIKPIIFDGLSVQGLEKLVLICMVMKWQHYKLSCCWTALLCGYACGYHLVKHYLKKTGKSIVEATLLPANEILKATEEFLEWIKNL